MKKRYLFLRILFSVMLLGGLGCVGIGVVNYMDATMPQQPVVYQSSLSVGENEGMGNMEVKLADNTESETDDAIVSARDDVAPYESIQETDGMTETEDGGVDNE